MRQPSRAAGSLAVAILAAMAFAAAARAVAGEASKEAKPPSASGTPPRSAAKRSALVAVVVAVLLAGCLGDGSGSKTTVDEGGAKAKPTSSEITVDTGADAGVETGDLEVKVKDDLGTPFAGATVAVVPSSLNRTLEVPPALSDKDGVATFKGLPAEGYKVEATAEGYETAVQGATVVSGQVAKVELELAYIITDSRFNVTVEYEGRVTCSAGAAVLVTCAVVKDQVKAAGFEHNPMFTWTYGNAATPPVDDKVFEVWVEVAWVENPDNVWNGGKLVLFDPSNRNANQISTTNRGPSENPPARVTASAQLLQGWGLDEGGTLGFELEPANFFYGPGYALNWQFNAYATVFYNGPADPCYSPARQKVVLTEACQEARAEMGP